MARRIKREFPGVTAYFDRHRKRRYRFRKKGFSTEIHGEYGSDDFRRNYEQAVTANGLGNAMRKWCDAAGLSACTSHGLRKACATRLAEAGASEREIMAWTGHSSPQMVQIYAGRARRGLMADQGFAKLRKNETGSDSDEPNTNGSTK